MSRENKKDIKSLFRDLCYELKQEDVDVDSIKSYLTDLEITVDEALEDEHDEGYDEGYKEGYDVGFYDGSEEAMFEEDVLDD